MKTTKFKIELEVEVAYDQPEEIITTPYTHFGVLVNEPLNVATFAAEEGDIVEANIIKAERIK